MNRLSVTLIERTEGGTRYHVHVLLESEDGCKRFLKTAYHSSVERDAYIDGIKGLAKLVGGIEIA